MLMLYRVFRMVVSRLDRLFQQSENAEPDTANPTVSPDDYKECSYLLQTISNLISTLSHNGWISLLTQTLVQTEKHKDTPASEGWF